jgi:hypothetical protein
MRLLSARSLFATVFSLFLMRSPASAESMKNLKTIRFPKNFSSQSVHKNLKFSAEYVNGHVASVRYEGETYNTLSHLNFWSDRCEIEFKIQLKRHYSSADPRDLKEVGVNNVAQDGEITTATFSGETDSALYGGKITCPEEMTLEDAQATFGKENVELLSQANLNQKSATPAGIPCLGSGKSFSHVKHFQINPDGSIDTVRDDGRKHHYRGPFPDLATFYNKFQVCI